MIKVGVIGLGYWGPNFVRNFIRNPQTEIVWACDVSLKAREEIQRYYPQIKLTADYQEILQDPTVNLVMVVTPPETHFQIARDVLEANKNVLIAKPITINSKEAQKLLSIAKQKQLLIYGDLTYLYTGAVKYIKSSIRKDSIGKPLYYDSTRANLGLIQKEVNVIWDLAPHDFSIIDACFGLKPVKVFATASKHYQGSKNYEMAHITINYTDGFIAHIHVSWLSPIKMRTVLIGGSKKMIYFDDVEPDEKIKIYDKGIDVSNEDITYMKPVYRSGDVIIPKLKVEEAIYLEIDEIVSQILKKKLNYENAELNIRIVKLLEACDKSIKTGKPVLFE
jgi:predicted dehydrogenase